MKQLFNITSEDSQTGDLIICELSHYHICLAGADAAGRLAWLKYFEKITPLTVADVSSLLQQEDMGVKRAQSLLIGSAFPDATLVPRQLATDKGLDSFIKYSTQDKVFVDDVAEQDLQVVYSIPDSFYNLLSQRSNSRTLHVHSAAIKMLPASNDNFIGLHFTSKEFRILAIKNGEVQLAQIYPFTAPLDVVYYLLMISAQYGLPQSETVVEMSGLVDESSALYKEIYQYYTQVQLAAPNQYDWHHSEYQPHFFSSIFNLASCASSVVS